MMKKKKQEKSFIELQKEWLLIEEKVLIFQKASSPDATELDKQEATLASEFIIKQFNPLFKKYMILLRNGHMSFSDVEMKQFVMLFIDRIDLKKALSRKRQTTEQRKEIYQLFNFVVETYGIESEEDMLSDLQMCLLILCNRYKQVGKNFCAYVYNTYRYEVARHIKKYFKSPLNIKYKHISYDDPRSFNPEYDDIHHEDELGLPDFTWVNGTSCSNIFSSLSNIQRKILIKYYLEDWNDRQIADYTGLHINTVNMKRRNATKLLAEKLDIEKVIRNRKSGRNASLPI